VERGINGVHHTNAKVFGLDLEERVLLCLGGLAGSEERSGGLLSVLGFGRPVMEMKSAKAALERLTNARAPRLRIDLEASDSWC